MRVRRTLICFFFLSLQDGNTLIDAEIVREKVGGSIRRACPFNFSGNKKIFCRNECRKKDILVETEGDRAERDRYSIEYTEGTYPVSSTVVYVSIKNLKKTDSGLYRCNLTRDWILFRDASHEFEIRVQDGFTVTSNPTSSSASTSTTTSTTTQSFSSTSGSSTASSSASSEATKQTTAAARPAQTTTGPLLYVGLTLLVMLIVLSAAVLIFCRKRGRKPKEPPVETEYVNVTAEAQVYEEIREEDRQLRPPPEGVSTIYTCAKFTKANGAEDLCSLITAVGPQNKTDDVSSKLTYSEVDFSNGPAASLSSAPRGDADNVVYSVPRVEASSDGVHAADASAPLYSTVGLTQM